MADAKEGVSETARGGRVYRLVRGTVRLWFKVFFHRIRLLREETIPASGPAVLAVGHPASFLDALILLTAFERHAHCLIERRLLGAWWKKALASTLKMIQYESSERTERRAWEACGKALAGGGAVMVFAEPRSPRGTEGASMALTAAQIALEAGANPEWERGTEVFPVHVFLPVEKAQSRELLIHVDRPLAVRQFLNAAAGRTEVTLASALEERWQANAFRQQDQDVEQFLSDLEGALRQDLEEEWSSRENWKQKVDGFHLSSALAGWMRELNTLNPGRLAALREMVEAWREAKRRAALRQIELETAHGWLESAAQRTWVWAATVAASPLALYGLINHAVILLLLAWGGLLGHESDRDPRVAWLLRGAVTLGCYTMQVILCSTLLGRAAAGYYAPTLPLSGALLWAYAWLWRHGTRPVMMRLTLRAQREKTRRMRKELVREIDRGMLVAS